ncbi:hypothetical protein K488DRAFT_72627 [Vararia minispora EC-137]|uniref:Uncharacterized protein n=1 Tax=Vararia minispora EC-137 TaxID=1314806 RepID=A0ACB8QDR0_9AGAM|nr:hypothetical protein K488DRAFT_72627 [Vararia minispora EC-137]
MSHSESHRAEDDRPAGGPYRTNRHHRRSSLDAAGSPIDPSNGQEIYSSSSRGAPYSIHGHGYPTPSSPSNPYPLHPVPYPDNYAAYRHAQAQGVGYANPNAYPAYQGPRHDGHPVVPSQHYHSSGIPATSADRHYQYHGYPPSSDSTSMSRQRTPPAAQICCDLCGTTFTRRHDLNRHMGSHHGDASYQCPFCTRTYARADSLKRHIDQPCPNRPKDGSNPSGASGSSRHGGGSSS